MLNIVLLHHQPLPICAIMNGMTRSLAMPTIQLPSHAPCAPQNGQQGLWVSISGNNVMGQPFGPRWQHRR